MLRLQLKGTEELKRALVSGGQDIAKNLGKAAKQGAYDILKEVRVNIKDTFQASRKSNPVKRSGTLAREWDISVERSQALLGTHVKYAAIHEFGGDVVPVKAKRLAIPIGDRIGSPRDYTDLHYGKSRAGNEFLIDETGKAQYLLRQRVTIPARPYFEPAIETARPKVIERFRRVIADALAKARGLGAAAK